MATLLVQLKLTARKPYQSRHTAATLWLAAGEAQEWIGKQLGHVNKVYTARIINRPIDATIQRLLFPGWIKS